MATEIQSNEDSVFSHTANLKSDLRLSAPRNSSRDNTAVAKNIEKAAYEIEEAISCLAESFNADAGGLAGAVKRFSDEDSALAQGFEK